MPGFFISNKKLNFELNDKFSENCINQEIDNETYTIKRNTLNKYMNDKIFEETKNYIIITEGVFLNKNQLCKSCKLNWLNTVEYMIKNNEYSYFDKFRGNFSGGHYNKTSKEFIIYTNHCEEKPIFYFEKDGLVLISSELRYIVNALNKLNIQYNVDNQAFYDILTFGYMVNNRTFINECKKLEYGHYIILKNGKITIKSYYELDNKKNLLNNWTDKQLIEKWDELFTNAIRLNYEKDKEYGYSYICELSGGIDSRMNTWVASKNLYKPINNISYAQTDSLDEKIAKKVSQQLNTELIVKSLNSGNIMLDFREIVELNYGLTIYTGISHTNSLVKLLDFKDLGAIETGVSGNVFLKEPEGTPLQGAYSLKLHKQINKEDLLDESKEDFEKYIVRNRNFRGNICSQIVLYNYAEVLSPFSNRDFMDFYFKIPYAKRDKDYIYIEWIKEKYPEATKIPVERFQNGLMTDSVFKQKIRKIKSYGLKYSIKYCLYKLHLIKKLESSPVSSRMNPYDKWYYENNEIRKEMDNYFNKFVKKEYELNLLNLQMYNDANYLYKEGTTREKAQVLTAIAAIEYLFLILK